MKLKIFAISILGLIFGVSANFRSSQYLTYQYQVVASGNSAGEIINLYQAKEYLIYAFDLITEGIIKEEHVRVVEDNIERLKKFPDSEISLISGTIYIVIGEGKGQTLNGYFKTSSCDDTVVEKKVFILDWLFPW